MRQSQQRENKRTASVLEAAAFYANRSLRCLVATVIAQATIIVAIAIAPVFGAGISIIIAAIFAARPVVVIVIMAVLFTFVSAVLAAVEIIPIIPATAKSHTIAKEIRSAIFIPAIVVGASATAAISDRFGRRGLFD